MSSNLPHMNALPAFVAAGTHSSFSKAAEELNVSHTSVLRHVRNLEARLGAPLFEKSGRNVQLTELGVEYHRRLAPLLSEISVVTDQVFNLSKTTVRISCERIFAYSWLIGKLYGNLSHEFLQSHKLDISAADDLVDVHGGEVDIAVRFLSDVLHVEDGELLMKTIAFPFAAPGFAGIDPDNLDLRHLSQQRLEYARWPERWKRWFESAGLRDVRVPNLNQEYDFQLSVQAARAGKTALLVPKELIESEVRAGNLVQLNKTGMVIGGIFLITSQRSRGNRHVQLVAEKIVALTDSLPK